MVIYADNVDVQNSIYDATHNGLLRIEGVIKIVDHCQNFVAS